VKANTWRLNTGTFRLGETTPTENPGPSGWGLGTRLTSLCYKNFVVVNLKLEWSSGVSKDGGGKLGIGSVGGV
jgi:hypothetical protein